MARQTDPTAHPERPYFPNARLLIFAKPPVPGQVKTRLIPRLGAQGAARLYEQLIQRTLTLAVQAAHCPVQLWCASDSDHPFFRQCAGDFNVTLHQQHGADLGERMHHAFAAVLAHHPYAILIGSDCPTLQAADLRQGFSSLDEGSDAVIAPAMDGGYVLLGLRRPSPALFTDMPWSSGEELGETRRRLQQLGWQWRELASQRDVDRPEDVEELL